MAQTRSCTLVVWNVHNYGVSSPHASLCSARWSKGAADMGIDRGLVIAAGDFKDCPEHKIGDHYDLLTRSLELCTDVHAGAPTR